MQDQHCAIAVAMLFAPRPRKRAAAAMSAGARVSSISVYNTRGLCFMAWLPDHSPPALLSILRTPCIHGDLIACFLLLFTQKGAEKLAWSMVTSISCIC